MALRLGTKFRHEEALLAAEGCGANRMATRTPAHIDSNDPTFSPSIPIATPGLRAAGRAILTMNLINSEDLSTQRHKPRRR